MTQLDHNRAIYQLANKCNVSVEEIKRMSIWGNHSPTMVPMLSETTVSGIIIDKLIIIASRQACDGTSRQKMD